MTQSIYIFRHGETDWNLAGRLQGGHDIPLNETGREQAERLRLFFKKNPVDVFLSSDLMRAKETAEIAGRDLAVPILVDRRLRETNLGQAEGLTRQEIEDRWGSEMMERWIATSAHDPHFRFPGGESKAEHLARLIEGLEANLRAHPHKRWGVASHGGAMRRILHHLAPAGPDARMIPNGTLYELSFHAERGLTLVHPNPIEIV